MKDKYEELAKKYNLPAYEEMVRSFEIDTVGKDENEIREVMKKMFDKIDFYTRTMESLIQPDSNFGSMKEASGLNVQEQSDVKKLYAEGMHLVRRFGEFTLDYSEQEAAEFVKEVFTAWSKMKPGLKKIMSKLREVWEKQHHEVAEKGYFG